MKFNKLHSIRYQYMLFMLLVLLIFTTVTTYLWYKETYHSAQQSAVNAVNEILNVSNENMEVVLRDMNYLVASSAVNQHEVISVLSKTDDISEQNRLNSNRKLQNYILNVTSYKHYLQGFMITDLNGFAFCSGDIPSFDVIMAQPWFPNIHQLGQKSVFIPTHGYQDANGNLITEDETITIIRPILSQTEVIGFVQADVRFSLLKKTFDINLKNKAQIHLLDPHSGEFAFSSHPASAPLTHAEREQLITQCSDTSGNFFSSFHGEKTLVIYNTSRLTGWKSIALISRDSLMEQYNNTSKTILTLQSVFIIGSVIVVSIFSHVLTRNLLSLNKAVSEFSRGNMNVTVSIRSKDEIGALSEQFNHMVKQIYLLMESTKQTEREKRDAELRALQAEINPHFLYNTLNTIKMLAAVQNVANIQEVSESLSHLLHAHMDRRRLVSVSEEIANIENYITIMQYRYTGKFLYTVLASEEAKSNYMLQMLLQPLVENAILHGIAPAKRQCILLIKIYHENENLKIRIQDNGVGMSMQKQTQLLQSPQSSASIGFSNVLYRMKLYFGKNQKIEIQSEENLFTIVELTLPIIVEGESCSYD